MIKCNQCEAQVNKLELFPGDICLNCWAVSPEGRYFPTAQELTRMWGGK